MFQEDTIASFQRKPARVVLAAYDKSADTDAAGRLKSLFRLITKPKRVWK